MAFAVCVQLASAAPSKPGAFPLSRVIGQPQSAVNKVLGDPVKRHELQPPEDFVGGTQVDYPDGPTWKALTTVFYRSKLSFYPICLRAETHVGRRIFYCVWVNEGQFRGNCEQIGASRGDPVSRHYQQTSH
jgi:hypothetical protein